MSSLLGHVAVGAALCLSRSRWAEPHTKVALPLMVGLSIAPDFDYLAIWFFGVHAHPRWTHSLAYALVLSTLAWWLTRGIRQRQPGMPGWAALFTVSVSHLVLDALVGVHGIAWWWPLSAHEPWWPWGVLPSAGHLRWNNYYLWRNLFIECGVLWPLLWAHVQISRHGPRASWVAHKGVWLGLVPIWLMFLGWSVAIHH